MAGFGGELLFFVGLGYVVLGPQRMHGVLQHIARARAEYEKARQELGSQYSMDTERKEPPA
jgi:hypothetical protein